MKANVLKAEQEPLKLVFPGKHTLNGKEAFFKDILTIEPFSTPLCMLSVPCVFFDVGDHARIKKKLAIGPAIVPGIKAGHGSL